MITWNAMQTFTHRKKNKCWELVVVDLQGPFSFSGYYIYLSGHLFVLKSPSYLWMCEYMFFLEERDWKNNFRLHQINLFRWHLWTHACWMFLFLVPKQFSEHNFLRYIVEYSIYYSKHNLYAYFPRYMFMSKPLQKMLWCCIYNEDSLQIISPTRKL